MLAACLALIVSPPASASASNQVPASPVHASLVGFNAGNIISDEVFTARDTMTEAQIQAFFEAKVPKCLGGTDKYGPIVCLKDYKTNSVNRPADQYCNGYSGATAEPASRIIARVSQSCGINPQVLIVMLQKEQSLVTHTWPSAWRYDKALGQGCPDDAACNPAYVGFFYQIYGAARQMKVYMEGYYFKYYAPGKTWNIRYNPDVACGSSPVTIANKATSALYYYTPYQPNAAALRAGYGEGDACSAYGNRNFYNYFTDWFGSTQTLPASVPPAVLQPINTSSHLLGVDGSGRLLAYPFSNGRWGAPVQLGLGFERRNIYGVGDFDGDGNRDIVDVRQDGTLDLVLGTGSGYATVRKMSTSLAGESLVASAGDFDGDGVSDLFSVGSDGTLRLWRGDGTGGFRPGVAVGWGWAGMNLLAGGADLSGDGVPDLVARKTDGTLFVYFGDGKGGWFGSMQIGSGWNGMTTIVSPGDFDGDGRADLLGRDSGGGLWLYSGQASGGVVGRGQIGVGWNMMTSMSGPGAVALKPRPMKTGSDIDGDGKPDVLAQADGGNLLVYRGDGAGGWKGSTTARTDWSGQLKMIPVGDFDGDGFSDVASVDSSGRLLLWSGDGSGALRAPRQIGQGWDPKWSILGRLDFDGDGRRDLLMRDSTGALLLYRGDGAGGVTGGGLRVGSGWGMFDLVFTAGDVDGDRKVDLLARKADDHSLWLYPTNGTGGWRTPKQIGAGWGGMTALFSVGDFDGDGASDVIARQSDGQLMLYRGDGSGGWRGVTNIGVGWSGFKSLG
ncbi:FG-GAP repeat domain-containing protein [Microbacterium arabinogalactanolyticum]|uniref:FG-GAP repeat domain-containing protein n=1 Tax=Microbacterium arabinogalactanolyticum TaxID=69365 RepID=UPI004043AD96